MKSAGKFTPFLGQSLIEYTLLGNCQSMQRKVKFGLGSRDEKSIVKNICEGGTGVTILYIHTFQSENYCYSVL